MARNTMHSPSAYPNVHQQVGELKHESSRQRQCSELSDYIVRVIPSESMRWRWWASGTPPTVDWTRWSSVIYARLSINREKLVAIPPQRSTAVEKWPFLCLGTSLFYVYVTDDDSSNNGRVTCSLNDTRLTLIYLTLNAYSLQISGSPPFDYEREQSLSIELKCTDMGERPLSSSVLLHFQLEDCNDNPPEINSSLSTNETLSVPYETIVLPFILAQFHVTDRDRSQSPTFTYSFTVTPALNLSLNNNGTLILRSIPPQMGLHLIHITVADAGNLTSSISIPVDIYSLNETRLLKTFSMENTSVILIISFFVIVFLASFLIGVCFLIAFLLRKKQPSKSSSCSCCYSCFHRPTKSIRNSTCDSMNSSTERADSSQKTSIEVLDDGRVSIGDGVVFLSFVVHVSSLYCQLTPPDDFLLYWSVSLCTDDENRCARLPMD